MSLEEKLQKWKDEMNISQQQGQKPPPPPLTPEEHAALTPQDKGLVQQYVKDVANSRTSTTAVGAPPPPPPPPHAAAPMRPVAQSPDLLAAIRGEHKLRKAPTHSDDTVPTVATTQSNTVQSFADELSKVLKGKKLSPKPSIDTGRLSDAETREQEVKGDERGQAAAPVVKPPHNPNPTATTQVETEAQKEQRLIRAQNGAFESYQQNLQILKLRSSTAPEDAAENIEAASKRYKQTLQPNQRSAFEVYQRVLSDSSNLDKEARDQATREATEIFKQSLNIIEAIAPVAPTSGKPLLKPKPKGLGMPEAASPIQVSPLSDAMIPPPVAVSAKSALPAAKKPTVTAPKPVLTAAQQASLLKPPVIARKPDPAALAAAETPAKRAPPKVAPKPEKALATAATPEKGPAVDKAPIPVTPPSTSVKPPLAEVPLKKAPKATTWGPQLDDMTRKLELRLAKALMIQEKLGDQGIGSILTAGNTSPHFKNAEAASKGMNDITTQFGATLSDSKITLLNKPKTIAETEKAIADLDKHLKSLETAVRAVGKPINAQVISIRAIIDTHIVSNYTTAKLIGEIRKDIKTELDKHPTLSSSVSKPITVSDPVVPNPKDKPALPAKDNPKPGNGSSLERDRLVAEQIRQDKELAERIARNEGATQQALFAQLTATSRAPNTQHRQASPTAGDPSLGARISELEARQLALEQASAHALAAAARGHAPLPPTLSSHAPQMFDNRGSNNLGSSRQQQDYDSLLIKFQKAVAKHPAVQVLTYDLLNTRTTLEENDREPVDHIQFLATKLSQERKPLSDAPGFTQQADGTYTITNSSALHGPIYTSRVDNSKPPKQVKGADGQPVYDILHYERGKLIHEKSFIAPDGVPTGSKPTIDPTVREEVLAVHAKIEQDRAQAMGKQPSKPGFPPAGMRDVVDTVASSVRHSVVSGNHTATRAYPPTANPGPGPRQI